MSQTTEKNPSPPAATRYALPTRRAGDTQKFKLGGQTFYVRTGLYPDGKLGEIWIDCAKEGAAFRSLANCLAVAVSIGLQHGVPLDEYVDAFTYTRFEPSGTVVGHDRLKNGLSFMDVIFRTLAIEHLGRHELAQVQVPPSPCEAKTE